MPVGCLGGGSGNGSHGGGGGGGPRGQQQQQHQPDLEVIVTSSILNSADQFAFMQQTLLMQIFRLTTPPNASNGNNNGCSLSSSTTSSTSTTSASSLTCPTCIAFSDHCCQQENGMILFQEFIEANIHCCVWEQRLSDALASLRYISLHICVQKIFDKEFGSFLKPNFLLSSEDRTSNCLVFSSPKDAYLNISNWVYIFSAFKNP